MIYRDLKPLNLLVDQSGHVVLSDMGLVAKVDKGEVVDENQYPFDDIIKSKMSIDERNLKMDEELQKDMKEKSIKTKPKASDSKRSPRHRRKVTVAFKSAMGTYGYRAPEMLNGEGYGRSVDWWALGCTVYKLLVGKSPFDKKVYQSILS